MRYLITSTRSEAKIIIGYDGEGLLCEVKLQDMPAAEHRLWLFRHAPLREEDVKAVFNQPHLKFQVLKVTFQDFWQKYSEKVAKKDAEAAWNRMSEAQRQMAYDYIDTYKAAVSRDRIRMMYPGTYLRAQRWLDHT